VITHLLESKVVTGIWVIQQFILPQYHPSHFGIIGKRNPHDALLLRGQNGDGILLGALLMVNASLPIE